MTQRQYTPQGKSHRVLRALADSASDLGFEGLCEATGIEKPGDVRGVLSALIADGQVCRRWIDSYRIRDAGREALARLDEQSASHVRCSSLASPESETSGFRTDAQSPAGYYRVKLDERRWRLTARGGLAVDWDQPADDSQVVKVEAV